MLILIKILYSINNKPGIYLNHKSITDDYKLTSNIGLTKFGIVKTGYALKNPEVPVVIKILDMQK